MRWKSSWRIVKLPCTRHRKDLCPQTDACQELEETSKAAQARFIRLEGDVLSERAAAHRTIQQLILGLVVQRKTVNDAKTRYRGVLRKLTEAKSTMSIVQTEANKRAQGDTTEANQRIKQLEGTKLRCRKPCERPRGRIRDPA